MRLLKLFLLQEITHLDNNINK